MEGEFYGSDFFAADDSGHGTGRGASGPLGILLAILQSLGSRRGLSAFRKALYWGFWGSIFMVAVKTGTVMQ